MADDNSSISTSTSGSNAESSESTFEINVKTLESQIYSFRVNKNMPVPSLKQKVASATGVPVEQQRLIFRGRVLKDDHLLSEYHVEDGHTLHLVVRPTAQLQTPTGTNSGETNRNTDNRGNDTSAGVPRSRVGVSRSVLLGSFNMGDHGAEGNVPDLSRIIGAVLNSMGIGSQNPTGATSGIPSNVSGQASQGAETGGTNGDSGGRSQAGNQMPPGHAVPNHPFQSPNQSLPFPLGGAAVVIPTPQMPIPDALHTLSDFINCMELALSATGYWSSPSSTSIGDPPQENLPSNARGLPTPEALSVVLRRTQQLISGHALAALSHIAGRLEGDGGSTDRTLRNQIQTESVQIGLAMQHLGSLFLELGRTILTLRMGQSPAESFVNAGPAVYISPSGPNPIMVQPFPLQTSSLFGGPAGSQTISGVMGSVVPVDGPRNVNIHIHAVGSRAINGERNHQEPPNGSRSVDLGQMRAVPMRNGVATAVPPHPSSQAADHVPNAPHPHGMAQSAGAVTSSTMQSRIDESALRSPSESISIPTLVAEISAQIRNLVGNMHGEIQVPPGESEDSTHLGSSSDPSVGNDSSNLQQENLAIHGLEENEGSLTACNYERLEQQQQESHQLRNEGDISVSRSSNEASSPSAGIPSSSCPIGETALPHRSAASSDGASKSSSSHDSLGAEKDVPLGLGLGGLQPKRRSKQVKSQGKNVTGTSRDQPANENQQAIASGQQVLQSLVSRGASATSRDANGPSRESPLFGQNMPIGAPESGGQIDAVGMMSQVLNSPALNGLLAGVSEQAGIGSPDGLRNMLEQFTQSPSMRNTLNHIVQQIEGQELSNFSGMARGQGGGFDLSRMVQQMMPIVSQALTGAPTRPEPSYGSESRDQQQYDMAELPELNKPNQDSQSDLQQVTEMIERNDPPGDIFRNVVEHVASLCSEGDYEGLVEELCANEDLTREFLVMIHRDMRQP